MAPTFTAEKKEREAERRSLSEQSVWFLSGNARCWFAEARCPAALAAVRPLHLARSALGVQNDREDEFF